MPGINLPSRMTNLLIQFYSLTRSSVLQLRCQRNYSIEKRAVGLILGVYQEEDGKPPKLTMTGEKFDQRLAGKLTELIKEYKITGYLGTGKVFNNIDIDYRSIALVGLGREGVGFNELEMLDEGMENARMAAGVGARVLQTDGCTEIHIDSMDYPEQVAEGSALAVWRYVENRKKSNRMSKPRLEIYDCPDVDAWTRGIFKAEAQNLARRLIDAPANLMTPTTFSQAACDALCACGATVEIHTMDWMEYYQMNAFLAVTKGSCEPPVVLECNYCGTTPSEKPIMLVGQGLTFDSGGICLTACRNMDEMRAMMGGAAVVVGAIRAAAALSLPINISAMIPLCENMPSGMAAQLGNVVKLMNGKTIAIRDLTKAGVLIMADPMIYGQTNHKPRLIVSVATMGDGVKLALGGGATGIFSNSHYIWKQFQKAGSITGDRMWRLPLWNIFKKRVTNNVSYDLTNDGTGPASSCLAAAVLHELVSCTDWAHLDIRGVGMLTKNDSIPYLAAGQMTGRPTRTIVQFLYQMACPAAMK